MTELILGDCLELMKNIPDGSVDMILCDPPYGTTALKWDNILSFDKLWKQYERVIKDNGIIVIFAMQPFTSLMITSNIKMYRYSWIWQKDIKTGFLNANYKPLNETEDILVFSKATVGSLSKNPIPYHPPTLKKVDLQKKNNPNSNWRKNKGYPPGTNILNSNSPFVQKYTGYPSNILKFNGAKDKVHPTEKPVPLLEYLIKTYTNPGETVLDNTMGSGSTGVACINTGRSFIGIELDEKYYKIACDRINNNGT